jgi:hypothetical protein
MVVGAVARSRAFGTGMGAYGAAVSVYSHFMARGHEVVFPKNTAMQVGIGTHAAGKRAANDGAPTASAGSAALVDSGVGLVASLH